MLFRALFALVAAGFVLVDAASIAYDKVEPIPQPEPVTTSERAGVKFKPQLYIDCGCASFPAVSAEGETSSGLPRDGGNFGCTQAPLGSQVYGRATWHNGVWAIMYSWYYPKSFVALIGTSTHDWQNVVVWISNPGVANPKILGISTSKQSETDYMKAITKETFKSNTNYDKKTTGLDQYLNDTSFKLISTMILGPLFLRPTTDPGQTQDLIMWNQLPETARVALNAADFGDAQVPFNDANFEKNLKDAFILD
ncbi:Necrosis inducing protein NPP1 [Phytophthora megakarya]|uniref:Necrosis inducing protein NPP1 n=1 Tax=Phytophthora megakarya TaxID=4795 RepID=A0A225VW32_9STRA|nr:Necrosis inducing protein NPP1 [Phytophthora megakarya]